MPRVKSIKPTLIYWLIDRRPETLAQGYAIGRPFYCGKTIASLEHRLNQHYWTAARHPERAIAKALLSYGRDNIDIRLMEIVPIGCDWAERERHWILMLRTAFSDVVNITSGGNGAAGMVHRQESREKIRQSLTGKKHSEARNAKRSAALRGKKFSPERRAKLVGRKLSEETKAKMRIARNRHDKGTRKGQKRTDEERLRMSQGWARRRALGLKNKSRTTANGVAK